MEMGGPIAADTSAQPRVPFKNRRRWLIGFGVVEILIACACLLFVAITVVEFIASDLPNRPTDAPFPGPADFMAMLVCGGLVPLFTVLGLGSIKCRNWARIASQIVGRSWLFIGVLISLFFVVVVPMVTEPQTWLSPQQLHLVTLAMVFIMVVVSATLLAFYSLKSVRATCRASARALTSALEGRERASGYRRTRSGLRSCRLFPARSHSRSSHIRSCITLHRGDVLWKDKTLGSLMSWRSSFHRKPDNAEGSIGGLELLA